MLIFRKKPEIFCGIRASGNIVHSGPATDEGRLSLSNCQGADLDTGRGPIRLPPKLFLARVLVTSHGVRRGEAGSSPDIWGSQNNQERILTDNLNGMCYNALTFT